MKSLNRFEVLQNVALYLEGRRRHAHQHQQRLPCDDQVYGLTAEAELLINGTFSSRKPRRCELIFDRLDRSCSVV